MASALKDGEDGALLHGRYEILEEIGRGGFGAVYRAKDTALNRICAVKENLNDTDEASRQFHREASLLAGLNHLSLPRVTDHFRIDGQGQYLVMDFIRGKSLQELLVEKKGPLDPDDMQKWMIQVTQALDYLHKRRPPIIHRDIKPANIIVNDRGRAILVDFGISKIAEDGGQTTMGARAITPGFSPPEQYGVSSTDSRSDLYSLGATIYACLTAKNPPESIQMMMGQSTLPEPESLNGTISRPLGDVIRQSMTLTMDSRYQSAAEMERALEHASNPLLGEQAAVPVEFETGKPPDIFEQNFAPTADPPKAEPQSKPASDPIMPTPSAPSVAPTPAVPPQSAPISSPVSRSKKRKSGLPPWAWVIVGIGLFLVLCVVSLGVLGALLPEATPTAVAPLGNGDEADLPVVNPADPIEVDGYVINWRIGGDGAGISTAGINGQKMRMMAVDRQTGNIYATTLNQIVVFNRSGELINSTNYRFAGFTDDMLVGPDGNLYILDGSSPDNFVRVFDPNLNVVRAFGSRGIGESDVSSGSPTSLVFGQDGLLWMLDYNRSGDRPNDRLLKFDPITGDVVQKFDQNADFVTSDKLVQAPDGKVFVLDGSNATVFEVNDLFEAVRDIQVPGISFADALGVAADGTFYASVSDDQVLIHFDRAGNLIKRFGDRSEESDVAYDAGTFYNVEKIVIVDDNVIVLDESVSYSYIVSIFP